MRQFWCSMSKSTEDRSNHVLWLRGQQTAPIACTASFHGTRGPRHKVSWLRAQMKPQPKHYTHKHNTTSVLQQKLQAHQVYITPTGGVIVIRHGPNTTTPCSNARSSCQYWCITVRYKHSTHDTVVVGTHVSFSAQGLSVTVARKPMPQRLTVLIT